MTFEAMKIDQRDAKGGAGRGEFLSLAIGFAFLVAVGAALVFLVARNADFNVQVSRTLETRTEILSVLSLAQDAETGQRGYLLTDDERYLGPYNAAISQVDERLARLSELISPGGPQAADLKALEAALRNKLSELAETVALQRSGKQDAARALVDTDIGRNAMTAIRLIVETMSAREHRVFLDRSASAANSGRLLLAFMVLGLAVAAILAFAAQTTLRRQTRVIDKDRVSLSGLNVGLEAAVAERTAELISANKEIQRFAYIVSHDLRAPLVNVMGFTSELDAARRTLKEQIDGLDEAGAAKVSPEARLAIEQDLPEAIGFIRSSTAKMDRLINAILKLSREGSRLIQPESVAVEDVVKSIADTIYQQTQDADAAIEVKPGLPAIVTDRLTLEQIFQNLIENAVKYLDRSRPGRIAVSGRRVGAQVEYAIEDNGRGIAPQDQERVFELFRRAGAQDQAGEGVGLAFVRANVRRLGGTIRLTSEPGQGSTFHLTFPAVFRPQTESRAA